MFQDRMALAAVHRWYATLVVVAAMVMAAGFMVYFANVALTMLSRPPASDEV
jgi:hypothetical protein